MAKITCGSLIRRAAGPNILGTAGCLVQWPGKTDQLLLLTAARVLVGRTAEQFEAIEAVDQPGKPIGCLYAWSDLQGPATADVALVHVDPALVDAGIGPSGAAPKGTNLNPAVGDKLTIFADGKGHNLTITDFGDKTIDRVAPDSRASVNYLNQIICDPAMEDRCVGAMAMDGSNKIVGMVVGGDGRAFTLVTPIDALLSCTFGGPPGPALEVRTSVPGSAKAPEKVTHPDHLGIQQIRAAAAGPGGGTGGDKAEYVVWYGTNRRPNDPGEVAKGYSAVRDNVVHFGSCRVFIPRAHKIGSIGSPWWKRLLTLTDDRLRLLAIDESQQGAYWGRIGVQLAAITAEERSALIFVHGYNVSFQEAALRAAQIGFDLSVKGAMAFFSWPSQGATSGYPADEATIEASEGAIADFMTDFAEKSGAGAVHIIAHSMGNRGVLRAVNRIVTKAQQRTGKPFGQVMLAAADVDADVFRQLSAAYAEVANRTTLYVSKRDLAVEASRWLHNFPRAGLMPPTLVLPGIDTINVTNVDLTLLGHGYVAEARDVLIDMHALITHGAPPNERFGLREAKNEEGEGYWLIGA